MSCVHASYWARVNLTDSYGTLLQAPGQAASSWTAAMTEGVFAVAVIVGLQFIITWMSVRFAWVRNLVKARPTLLLDSGRLLQNAMRSQRVTDSEVRAAIRAAGIATLEEVSAVVLETDGSFSVIKNAQVRTDSALQDVDRSGN